MTTQRQHVRRPEDAHVAPHFRKRAPSAAGGLLPDQRRTRAPFDVVSSMLWSVVATISSAWLVVLAFAVKYALT